LYIFGRFIENKAKFSLCLIKHHTVEFHAFLTSAAVAVYGQLHACTTLLPGVEPPVHVTWRLDGFQGRSIHCGIDENLCWKLKSNSSSYNP
jgi:hypothetical protein